MTLDELLGQHIVACVQAGRGPIEFGGKLRLQQRLQEHGFTLVDVAPAVGATAMVTAWSPDNHLVTRPIVIQ